MFRLQALPPPSFIIKARLGCIRNPGEPGRGKPSRPSLCSELDLGSSPDNATVSDPNQSISQGGRHQNQRWNSSRQKHSVSTREGVGQETKV